MSDGPSGDLKRGLSLIKYLLPLILVLVAAGGWVARQEGKIETLEKNDVEMKLRIGELNNQLGSLASTLQQALSAHAQIGAHGIADSRISAVENAVPVQAARIRELEADVARLQRYARRDSRRGP